MAIYKISYVITGSDHPGVILNASDRPQAGDFIRIGNQEFEVYEVFDITPPNGDFYHVQANCHPSSP